MAVKTFNSLPKFKKNQELLFVAGIAAVCVLTIVAMNWPEILLLFRNKRKK
jgi:hypothetical protein